MVIRLQKIDFNCLHKKNKINKYIHLSVICKIVKLQNCKCLTMLINPPITTAQPLFKLKVYQPLCIIFNADQNCLLTKHFHD